jgi:cardiolipin synthase
VFYKLIIFKTIFKNINFRNHEKCLIIDETTAIIGGSNLNDQSVNIANNDNYSDLNYLLSGNIIRSITAQFFHNVLIFSNASKKQRLLIKTQLSKICIKDKINEQCFLHFFNSMPNSKNNLLEKLYLNLIYGAKKTIKIVTPYFVPTSQLLYALNIAIARGVKLEIVIPKRNEMNHTTYLLNMMCVKELAKIGGIIHEYYGFCHAKIFLVDDTYTVFGTNNFDYRSFYLNFEGCVYSNDKNINSQLNTIFNDTFVAHASLFELESKKHLSNSLYVKIFSLIKLFF